MYLVLPAEQHFRGLTGSGLDTDSATHTTEVGVPLGSGESAWLHY